MRNGLLVIGYLLAFFIVVAIRDALPDNDWVIALVSAGLLIGGLAVWLYVARNQRPDEPVS